MRDSKGRFVKGHKPLSSPKAMLEHNKKYGNWNKGLKNEKNFIKRK